MRKTGTPRLMILALIAPPILLAAMAASSLLSGAGTMGALLTYALVLLAVGMNQIRHRISTIAVMTSIAGIVALLVGLANFHWIISVTGISVAALAMLMLSKIEKRGWTYEK